MSMPTINLSDIGSDIVRNNIAASIALQEAALSHILNAEGEKLQAIIAMDDVTVEQLTQVNATVVELIEHASAFETTLQEKLQHIFPSAQPVEPDQLVAANTRILLPGMPPEGDVPFRENLYTHGTSISHEANSADFMINEAGNYQINYQSVLVNAAQAVDQPINAVLTLVASTAGVLATNISTVNYSLLSNIVVTQLAAGETLHLYAAGEGELMAIASAIIIKKLDTV
jgi:hypothetical protein